jgi:hypothetical protein
MMNRCNVWIALLICLLPGSLCHADSSAPHFVKLFNGKDLSGWEGDATAWAVRDGAITCLGTSSKKNWLIWRGGLPGDFELHLRFKFSEGNSGVQVRSEEIAKWQVRGYQAEVAPRNKMGMWHHSLKPAPHRHYLATAGERVRIAVDGKKKVEQIADAQEIQSAYHENEWNKLVIIARGPRLVQIINGVVFSELIDEDERFATRTGLIAFQDHGGGTVAQFKDIRLKELADISRKRSVSVSSSDEFRIAAAALVPGTTLDLAPGVYELAEKIIVKARATAERPILIRATDPANTRIRGAEGIHIDGSSHVLIDGLTFEGRRGLRCQHSEHVRVTNCRFQLTQTGEKCVWLGFDDSRYCRVDHCEFGARDDPGSYVHISRGNRYFRIDHNYFHDFRELGYNGGESIYLHGTGVWAIHAVVENNLFERCNGEGELIGIKSHRNIIRGNMFRECRGAVSVRDGSYNSVCGNVFLSLDEPRAAGGRIHGKHNAFVNNYLCGIYKPIECCWGETDAPHREDVTGHGSLTKLAFAYRASHDNLVAHNTFVDCGTVFQWTKKRIPIEQIREKMGMVERNGPFLAKLWREETSRYRVGDFVVPVYPARRWYVLGNVFLNTPQLVRENLGDGAEPPVQEEGFRWEGNIAFCRDGEFDVGPARSFQEHQVQYRDPELIEEAPGIFRPGPSSFSRGRASVDTKAVKTYANNPEIEAQLGDMKDSGAGRYTILTAADVGPDKARQPISCGADRLSQWRWTPAQSGQSMTARARFPTHRRCPSFPFRRSASAKDCSDRPD